MKKKCKSMSFHSLLPPTALFPTQDPRSRGNRTPAPCYRSNSLPGPCAPLTGQGLARPPGSLRLCSWGHRRPCHLARAAQGQRLGGSTCNSRAPDDLSPEDTRSAVEAGGPGDPARSSWSRRGVPGALGLSSGAGTSSPGVRPTLHICSWPRTHISPPEGEGVPKAEGWQ